MKVFLTGGAGFIGSHLLVQLIRLGHDVTVVDDFNDYYDPSIKRSNLPSSGFKLIERDIQESAALVLNEKPDLLIHLAARAGVRPSLQNPMLYERVNVAGTLVLLEACKQAGTKRFIFASSSSVYGNATVPFTEDNPQLAPISPYGISKLAGEHYVRNYARLYGLQSTCLRFFTVYGPRQRPDMAISAFTAAIESGKEITLFGDGSSQRDYTYIDDIIQGVLAAVAKPEPFATYNLGESRTTTLSSLISLLEKNIGKKARLKFLPPQPGDVEQTFASIEKARVNLGYLPTVPIEEGIRRYVIWHKRG